MAVCKLVIVNSSVFIKYCAVVHTYTLRRTNMQCVYSVTNMASFIFSGGRVITVEGSHFEAIQQPYMMFISPGGDCSTVNDVGCNKTVS